jgi:hypothetical protein
MPDIYDGIKKMTDDEISMQIAFLNNVTLLNVAKETGNRVIGGLAELANAFTGAFSKKTTFDYQTTGVSDIVNDAYVKLKSKDRIQLEYELKTALQERCMDLTDELHGEQLGQERIAVILVNEAAKLYGIEKYKTPANKIEEISIQYNNAFLSALHNNLVRQDAREAAKSDQAIQNRLNEVSLDTKRELQQALMPKEFSGKGIGRILRLEKSVKYLSYTVTFLGPDCFDYISTNVSTVFHALKGFKRMQRVLLAQFVWKSRMAYGKKYTINTDLLPGFIPVNQRSAFIEEETAFRGTLTGRIEAEDNLKKCDIAIEKTELQLAELKDRLELEQRDYDEVQMKFMGLESRKDEYVTGKRSDAESKVYYSDVNETKRQLDRALADYNKRKSHVKELEDKLKSLATERNRALLNLEVNKKKTDEKVVELSQRMMKKWVAYYYKFKFENGIFERIVIDFTNSEILCIEEMLKEMHDSKDIHAYAVRVEDNADSEIEIPNTEALNTEVSSAEEEDIKVPNAEVLNADVEGIGQMQIDEAKTEKVSEKAICYVAPGKNAVITYEDIIIKEIIRMK